MADLMAPTLPLGTRVPAESDRDAPGRLSPVTPYGNGGMTPPCRALTTREELPSHTADKSDFNLIEPAVSRDLARRRRS
jgi:hypothetical protein